MCALHSSDFFGGCQRAAGRSATKRCNPSYANNNLKGYSESRRDAQGRMLGQKFPPSGTSAAFARSRGRLRGKNLGGSARQLAVGNLQASWYLTWEVPFWSYIGGGYASNSCHHHL
jgi:hypothetical protein